MSDERLNEKFLELATPTLGRAQSEALLDRLWRLDEAEDVDEVLG
jgi:hypothetical protein